MKKFMTVAALLLLTIIASAQTDFSGKWKLNKEKSTMNSEFSMAPSEIIIVQSGSEINLERHSNFQGETMILKDKITLDGKESINSGFMDTKKKSVAAFSADKTVLTIDSKIAMDDGNETLRWASHYLSEMAKALIDDVTLGLQQVQDTRI